jgi:parallel beta-helix repeat protein
MGHGILIDTTYISTEENGLYIDSHIIRVYFYDENKTKIAQRTCSAFEGISSDLIPINTKYFRVVLASHVKLQGFSGNLYFLSYDFAEKCEVINCTVDNSRRNGITVTASIDCTIENNLIINTNGKTPQRGIDVEPEWGGCSGLTITGNTFYGNATGSLACTKCRNLKIIKNRMYEGLSITRCIYFEFSDNIVTDFASVSLNSPMTTSIEQPMSIIRNNRFVATEYEVNTYLMFTNALVKDNFFYNVSSLASQNDNSKVIGNVIHITGVNRKSFVCRTSYMTNNIIKAENKNITIETPVICDNTFNCSSVTLSPPVRFTTDIYNIRLDMTGNIFNVSGINGVIFNNLPYTLLNISDNIVTFTSSNKALTFIKGTMQDDSTLFICNNIFNKECDIFNTSVNKGIVTTDKNYFKKGD